MADPYAFFSDTMFYHIIHSVLLLILSILAGLAVALRFWARRIKKLSLELDDYLVMIGLVPDIDASHFLSSNMVQIFAMAKTAMYIYGTLLMPYIDTRTPLKCYSILLAQGQRPTEIGLRGRSFIPEHDV